MGRNEGTVKGENLADSSSSAATATADGVGGAVERQAAQDVADVAEAVAEAPEEYADTDYIRSEAVGEGSIVDSRPESEVESSEGPHREGVDGKDHRGRNRIDRVARSSVAVLAAALTVTVILATTALAYDKVQAERIPPDVQISDVPVGGLTREEARAAVMTKVAAVSRRTLYLNAAGKTFSVPLAELDIEARVDEALDRAFEERNRQGVIGRLKRWLGGGGRLVVVPLEILPSREPIERRVVASIAGAVNKEPTEAAIEETTDDLVFRPPSPGVELEGEASSDLIFQAAQSLIEGRDPGIVRLPTKEIPVREGAGITTAILVRIKQQRLYFYENATLSGVYKVSTGTPQYPTPIGKFRVIRKIVNPSWTNPAPNGWGKDMPAYIPPGPSNPLGTRALQLNSPGILIHGTQNIRALGSPASHGCIRMNMNEIEALFPRVPEGTPVFIRP